MTLAYANPGSGPSAGGIGWFNFNNLALKPGDSITGLTGTLKDGTTVTFDLESLSTSQRIFNAVQPPTYGGVPFGNSSYTGILGNIALNTNYVFSPTTSTIVLSNIVVKDSLGNPVTNYTAVVADVESTNTSESWILNTDGQSWNQLASLGGNLPTLTGLGTQSATITGVNNAVAGNYVLTTQSPDTLTLTTDTTSTGGGNQGVAIGFAVTRVIVRSNIGDRIDSNDQFLLDIQGTPSDQATTTGTANGIQNEFASIFGFANNTYTVTQAMGVGSVNPLSAYKQTISAVNVSTGGLVPPIGPLPISFAPQLGDIIVYDILNSAPQTFVKSADKAFADLGDTITYTVTVDNPNAFTVNNVLMTDPLPAGTSFIDIVSVGAPYVGTNPATGITILAIGPNDSVDVVWRVKVNSSQPMFNSISNVATVNVPGGTSGSTNIVTTQINHADLTSTGNFLKSGSPSNINIGDTITYTLTVKNTGNTAANSVVITDPIPVGTTYVPGSVTATTAFTGDPTTSIKLTSPIAASQSVTITFKVKIGNSIPSTNPINNKAEIDYTYTVDPAKPNAVAVNGFTNTTETTVSNATLITKKSSDKVIAYMCDKITYNISITNTGNVPANKVVITDPVPNGTVYVPGSLTVSTPYTGTPLTTIQLTSPIAPGEVVAVSFQVQVVAIPNPNPINNKAVVAYAYTVNPLDPNGVTATSTSNLATTVVFRYNFSQEITDLIQSIALEQAALAAIANAEGKKIQTMVAMKDVTSEELLCLNKSVADMIDSMTILESILKQKLNTVSCQIAPSPSSCS